MAFLFGRLKTKESKQNKDNHNLNDLLDNNFIEIGSYQPENVFKDILILPTFSSFITHINIIDNTRVIFGDYNGNLTVWDVENGQQLAKMKHHTESINGTIVLNRKSLNENVSNDFIFKSIIALSSDKSISCWDESLYNIINTVNCGTNVHKIIMSVNDNYFITAGLDLKLFNSNLQEISEYNRTNKENSIKLIIKIKNDRLVIASNFDIEIYGLVRNSLQQIPTNDRTSETVAQEKNEDGFRIKELKRYLNAHKDSILSLENISENVFASGSSDGHLVLWLSQTLIKSIEIRPFQELIKNEMISRLNITSINSIRTLYERYIVISCGNHLCIYDNLCKDICCQIINAHNSKITDMLIINVQIITSSEDGSIRVWKIEEVEKEDENLTFQKLNLILIGECLGHSASIKRLSTITKNEILSIDFDNMVIIWRNSDLVENNRNLVLKKIFSKVNI